MDQVAANGPVVREAIAFAIGCATRQWIVDVQETVRAATTNCARAGSVTVIDLAQLENRGASVLRQRPAVACHRGKGNANPRMHVLVAAGLVTSPALGHPYAPSSDLNVLIPLRSLRQSPEHMCIGGYR